MKLAFLAVAASLMAASAGAATVQESFSGNLSFYDTRGIYECYDGITDCQILPLAGFDASRGTLRKVVVDLRLSNDGPAWSFLDPSSYGTRLDVEMVYVSGFNGIFPFGDIWHIGQISQTITILHGTHEFEWSYSASQTFVFDTPDIALIASDSAPVARIGGFSSGPYLGRYQPPYYSLWLKDLGQYEFDITYHYDVGVVPLPASIFPLLAGLGAFAALRRRRGALSAQRDGA